jgi:NADPH:quinone reductase-like Zn-dependent oxidoreductase
MPKTVWPGREAHATDPEVLTPRAVATPDPDPGEVRIAVDSSGVNFADCMARIGIYEKTPELPAVIRWEVAW